MKTLDEVIKALEICTSDRGGCEGCPYDPDCKPDKKWDDALFYLKEYREKHDDILQMEEALGYCEIMDNPPLTWDELKSMEGKPVWIEYDIIHKDRTLRVWCLVLIVLDEYMSIQTNAVAFRVEKSEIGTKWQAYRKEQTNEYA